MQVSRGSPKGCVSSYFEPSCANLVAISGLCFGLYADMLGPAGTHANALRGMVFGMVVRAGWGGSLSQQNARLWAVWDSFGLRHAQIHGWWEARRCCVDFKGVEVGDYCRRCWPEVARLSPHPGTPRQKL